jgi:hypothetical protein
MLEKILKDLEELTPGELQRLRRHVNEIIAGPSVSYQRRGNYYYGFFRHGDKVHTVYIGKTFREIDPLAELRRKQSKSKAKAK